VKEAAIAEEIGIIVQAHVARRGKADTFEQAQVEGIAHRIGEEEQEQDDEWGEEEIGCEAALVSTPPDPYCCRPCPGHAASWCGDAHRPLPFLTCCPVP